MKDVKGVIPIVAATFTENGELDFESMRSLIRHLAKIGCNGMALFGIAGEYYKLTDEEQFKSIHVMVEECRKADVASVVSITQHSTKAAIERAKYAEAAGADCLMLLPPFFLKPSGQDLYDHLRNVATSVKIPVMVQYAPEQTGVSIAPSVLGQIQKEADNPIYYKIECKPAGPYISSLLKIIGNDTRIFAGNAGYQMIESFDRGAVGVMPGCSMSELYIKIYRLYMAGKRMEAIELHNKLLPILNHIRQNVEMIICYEKKILALRGIIASDYCRAPRFTGDKLMDEMFYMYYEQIKDYLQ